MCEHRVAGHWGRIWSVWLALTLGSFGVLEGIGMVESGTDGTLSYYLRTTAGLEHPCRHAHAGRASILAVLSWAAIHLCWGVLGFPPWRYGPEAVVRSN